MSFRPDGSDVRVYAKGIRAPFGLAYDRVTGALVASMNQRDDLGAKTPGDWLALVRGRELALPRLLRPERERVPGRSKPLAVLDKHAAAGGVAIISGQLGSAVGRGARDRVGAGERPARAAPALGRGVRE